MRSNKPIKRVLLWVVVVLVACQLAACTGGGAKPQPAPQETKPASPSPAPAQPAAPIVLKASSGDQDNYPAVKGLLKFAELVGQKTNGKIKVEVYTNGTLYGDQQAEVEAAKAGTIAFSLPQVSVLSAWEPKVDFFVMPYLFKDAAHAEKVLDSEIAAKIFAGLENNGLKIVAPLTGGGMRSFYNSKKPIKTPDDIKGLKLRTTKSPLANEAFSALGAIPTPIAWGELYAALQQRVVDGAEHAPTDVLLYKFHEVCKYYSLDEHTYELMPLVASVKVLNSLPEDLRKIVLDCAKETVPYVRKIAREETEKALAEIEKKAVVVKDVKKEAFIEKVKPVNAKYAEKLGKDIFDAINSAR
ncbi:MAG: TRAP transporter substrate-binding protein [Firmicutes bacterium]|nr:TRAP transporter substrate-binding protein [Bacillota bacterium]